MCRWEEGRTMRVKSRRPRMGSGRLRVRVDDGGDNSAAREEKARFLLCRQGLTHAQDSPGLIADWIVHGKLLADWK